MVFGHRGARGLRPENTLCAFEHAIDLGVDGVEMDVMKCGSGEAIVFHDYRMEYLAGYASWTESTSISKIKTLEAGGHFHPKYCGERIPTLDDTLDLIRDRVIVNLELKGEQASADGLEKTVVDAIRRHKLTDSVIVSSFNPIRLARVSKLAPEIAIGMLMIPDWADIARWFFFAPALGARFCNPEISMTNPEFTSAHKRKGRIVIGWPANSVADLNRLLKAGVDGVISDRPDLMIEAITE